LATRLLEGKIVNLRVAEKEDLSLVGEWRNNPEFQGEYDLLIQESKEELAKRYDRFHPDEKWFLIEKKDGTKIGLIVLELEGGVQEIGYDIIPNERGKGYCTEAVKIAVDYLFLSKPLVRIQAHTNVKNTASQRVLEKADFKKEGTVRKRIFVRGSWRDEFLYGILREEWKEPKILTKTI
jgi:ribosomal-protein-alanine N-acetyltransferase